MKNIFGFFKTYKKFIFVIALIFTSLASAESRLYQIPPSSSTSAHVPYISDEAMKHCIVLYNEAKWLREELERIEIDQYSQQSVNSYNTKVGQHTKKLEYFNKNCAGKQSESAYREAQKLNEAKSSANF